MKELEEIAERIRKIREALQKYLEKKEATIAVLKKELEELEKLCQENSF